MIEQEIAVAWALLVHQKVVYIVGEGGAFALRADELVFVLDGAGLGWGGTSGLRRLWSFRRSQCTGRGRRLGQGVGLLAGRLRMCS